VAELPDAQDLNLCVAIQREPVMCACRSPFSRTRIWRAMARSLAVPIALLATGRMLAQPAQSGCRPVADRTGDLGCWILADGAIGKLPSAPMFWHLDTYPTRAAAESAKRERGIVVEALGKMWLMTIAEKDWRPRSGLHVADIGPLPVQSGLTYASQYMEAIANPGTTSSIHTHSGPEAWYTEAGESCLETPEGTITARAGGPPMIVRGGPPMLLMSIGTVQRRAIDLVLHDASQQPITIEHVWKPKGQCKVP